MVVGYHLDGVKFDPVGYYVNDPSDPNIPVFDLKNGYFDVTNKVLASPQMVHDEDFGDFQPLPVRPNRRLFLRQQDTGDVDNR